VVDGYYAQLWARMQAAACMIPACLCPEALLFVWPAGRTVHYELRTRCGRRFEGAASDEREALRFGAVTLHDHGLHRFRLVSARPMEVPRA
jgi:hypothetical protein